MNVVSLGSSCVVSQMINNKDINNINGNLYTHLFTWSAVEINTIIKILQTPELLINNNFKVLYRLIRQTDGLNLLNNYGDDDVENFLQDIQNTSFQEENTCKKIKQ